MSITATPFSTEQYQHQDYERIDFPCAPCWVSYYAMKGMTHDYPPEFYWGENITRLQQEIDELKKKIEQIELPKTSEKPHFPVGPQAKPKPKLKKFRGVEL